MQIVSPTDASSVSGTVVVQVDAKDLEDAEGTLTVEVSTDGGATWNVAKSASGTLYDYSWVTLAGTDGAAYTLVARAADSSAVTTKSESIPVTVDNVDGASFASAAGK